MSERSFDVVVIGAGPSGIPGAAQAATGTLDAQAVLDRRDEIVHDFDDAGQLPWLSDQGIALVRGHARLEGERRVAVGDDVLVARRAVVIATGSDARRPPVEGVDDVCDGELRPELEGGGTVAGEHVPTNHSATVAVVGEVPVDRLFHAVAPFPTRSEVWLHLLEDYGL